MDWLLDRTFNAQIDFKEHHAEYKDYKKYTYLKAAACALQEKYKKYYNLADDSAVYYIAQVLLPNKKQWWFHQQFNGDESKKFWLYGNSELPTNRGV